jgi:hypothetical protein
MFQKPTTTDTTTHYNSNHPIEHKIAAYRFLLNRMSLLPLSQENKKQEMNIILQISRTNSYPLSIITQLNNRTKNTKRNMISNSAHTEQAMYISILPVAFTV